MQRTTQNLSAKSVSAELARGKIEQDSLALGEPGGGPKVQDAVRGEHDGGNDGGVEVVGPEAEDRVEGGNLEAKEGGHAEEIVPSVRGKGEVSVEEGLRRTASSA